MKGKFFIALLPAILFYASSCQHNSSSVNLENEHDTVAYIIGHNIGSSLKQSPMTEINIEAIAKGMQEAIDGKELFIDEFVAQNYVQQYMSKLENAKYAGNLEEGQAFLDENGKRAGVTTTESGLQYEVLVEGDGPKPTASDKVTVHYHGTLIDGTVFDSSVENGEPYQTGVSQVIQGWTEVLQLMPVGSKWKVYIPTELAYGANPRPGGVIEPNVPLLFEIELISID